MADLLLGYSPPAFKDLMVALVGAENPSLSITITENYPGKQSNLKREIRYY